MTDSSRPPLPGDVSAGCDPRDVPSLVRHIVASGQVDKHERVFEGVSDEDDPADWDIEWLSHDPPAGRLEPAGRSIDRGDQPVRLVPEARRKNYLRVALRKAECGLADAVVSPPDQVFKRAAIEAQTGLYVWHRDRHGVDLAEQRALLLHVITMATMAPGLRLKRSSYSRRKSPPSKQKSRPLTAGRQGLMSRVVTIRGGRASVFCTGHVASPRSRTATCLFVSRLRSLTAISILAIRS